MPCRNKLSILIADLVRIMRNVSVQCTEGERSKKVQEYLLRLQHSGYNKVEKHRESKKKRQDFTGNISNSQNVP